MHKNEKFKRLIEELRIRKDNIDIRRIAGSTVVYIYINPTLDDFGYVYRQLAYYTSTWEDVYITGVGIGSYITICFDDQIMNKEDII